METRANHVLIGTFTLLVFVGAFVFVLWIGKLSLEREWDYYDIYFTEAVTGLTVGGAVQYNGVQVGEVRKLSLAPDDPRQVIAHVRLNGSTPVKSDTRARLALLGLTGVAIIQLSGGTPAAPRLEPRPGEQAARIIADSSALQSLMTSSEGIASSMSDVLGRVEKLLSDDNMDHFAGTLKHVDEITGVLASERDELRSLIAELGGAGRQLRGTLDRIDVLTHSTDTLLNQQTRQLIVSAQAWIASAQRSTDTINAILEQNRAPLASFGNEGLVQIGPSLVELQATLKSLRAITERLQNEPAAAYLLGNERPREFTPQ
jgi:phospholipid/cholesterol/gamma-HCH transport system substrate-binding protein